MLEKVNFISQKSTPANNYNYKTDNVATKEIVNSVLKKETKPTTETFDWLNIDKLIEMVQKTNSAKEKITNRNLLKYCAGTRETMRNEKIQKEQEHIAKPITSRTAYNTKQLKACGVKDNDIKKYLTYDGHVNFEGKKILKEHGKSYK